ncbi:MAG TPA: ABC transporter ATP-binding protein [Geoalkalibacter subterraneus]|uniref:ABC transporter ATP-binding protein n=1 Tax=Geoalkalibacter subterraneus TaxID=483547 RepID=A0A831LEY7_9BACT|nr:ABC transporter ATP-binding protein [Geoalkalibacter subterraneus]
MNALGPARDIPGKPGCTPPGGDEVVRAEGLAKTYRRGTGAVKALRGVDLFLRRGDVTAVTGPSGSGKSTLLNIVGLLDTPDEGLVVIDGVQVDFRDTGKKELLRSHCLGFVFQTFNLMPVLSAVENVELPLLLRPIGHKERRERAAEMLVSVGLGDRLGHRPRELSAGQQQRVAVARALVAQPVLVLADEPTASLDSRSAFGLLDLMHDLNSVLGTTFLFTTHDPRLLDRVSKIVVLQDGRMA